MGILTWMMSRMRGVILNFGAQRAWGVGFVMLNLQSQSSHGVGLVSCVSQDGFLGNQRIGY